MKQYGVFVWPGVACGVVDMVPAPWLWQLQGPRGANPLATST